MREIFAAVELGFGGGDVIDELAVFEVVLPVGDIADECRRLAVLRDKDRSVRLGGAFEAGGEIVTALGEGDDVLGHDGTGNCRAAADGWTFFEGWHDNFLPKLLKTLYTIMFMPSRWLAKLIRHGGGGFW